MTGWDEARDWLAQYAPEWRFSRGDSSLVPGRTIGSPTEEHYEVILERREFPGADYGYYQMLIGRGTTLLSAIQDAVGGYRAG